MVSGRAAIFLVAERMVRWVDGGDGEFIGLPGELSLPGWGGVLALGGLALGKGDCWGAGATSGSAF